MTRTSPLAPDMTYAEKVKAGFLYRKKFKNDYSLTGFLKERKRKEEKQTEQNTARGDAVLEGFRKECLRHVGQYGQELVEDFYYHWKQVDKKTGKRLFEGKRCFDIDSQLRAWSKSEYTLSKETAALRLERAKGKIQGDRRPSSGACEGKGRREAAGCKHRRPAGHCRQARRGQCTAGT